MVAQLTKGALAEIFSGNELEMPVLQALDFKVIQSGTYLRHRLLISDGVYKSPSSMIATQLNDMVGKDLTNFTIFRVERYVVNTVAEGKKVMILLDITVLAPGSQVEHVIGTPTMYDMHSAASKTAPKTTQSQLNSTRVPLGSMNLNHSGASSSPMASKSSSAPIGVHPISSLTPYQNKWTICARVTNKSDIRTWSNSRGQGKLFSMDLLDESGEIRATAFNDQVDKYYDMIEINKVYYITQAQLKTANKQYSSLKNEYEMTFNQGTQVTVCHETSKIPTMQFQFVKIDQLEQVAKDSTIDVIGLCKEDFNMSTVTQKSTGKELKKRDIQIVDESGSEIRLTMWGMQAEKFDGSLNPIVAVKGAKVSDFNGKSLSLLSSSTFQINPDIKETHKLRAWYDTVGGDLETVNLSNQRSGGGSVGGNLKTIGEAAYENLGCGDQADYYSTKGTVCFIRKENCLYAACPAENCNKKVVDQNNGVYRCEKCNKEYDTFNHRLLLTVIFSDATDSVWTTIFQENAEALINCSAANLGAQKEQDEGEFSSTLNSPVFKEFMLKLRVKMETFNEERRLKTTVVSLQPLNIKEYNRILLKQIKSEAGFV